MYSTKVLLISKAAFGLPKNAGYRWFWRNKRFYDLYPCGP